MNMKMTSMVCAGAVVACLPASRASAASCESLATLALEGTAITKVEVVAPGTFQPPDGPPRGRNPYTALPEFCRVAATLTPTSDSDIKVEIWLPTFASGSGGQAPDKNVWNGKFQAVGNGGWAGVIGYAEMADALQGGYATASTDTGHVGGRGTFALGHPEKLVDFAWRSEHEMTATAKKVVEAFYGSGPKLSYWNGCSTGGRQGLKLAQMFPEDYNGIIAGAPANRTAISLWIADAVLRDPARYIPAAKYPVIHQAALAACDAGDGVTDGLIDDPRQCRFDPSVLLCPSTALGASDQASCLTAPQVAAVKQIYSNAVNPRTKKELFSSFVPGSELGWGAQAAGPDVQAMTYDQYRYVVFKDPNWDWKTFDFDKDVAKGDLPENLIMNATSPDLKAFFSRGGKLIMYHGWSDSLVPPVNTIKYYEQVVAHMGGGAKASEHVRLFMAPGMGHCAGGEGPDTFDKVKALEEWVERGQAPARFEASHRVSGRVDRTRPLCPYPQVARYSGAGSIDDAANFSCKAP